ncbi:MAG: DegT/DnrJ/EryC1/StrS family aminotransferase [Desulfobacterales bacterium]|nr:DegT/DnrJ/EryC1/StrS family aminotransferase [Desulfobacterales bacterium]
MKVPLLDIRRQYPTIENEALAVTQEIYKNQSFVLGSYVETLENEIAAYCNTPYAVGVSSGTDALLISLMAADIGKNDFVITSPYTFFATAGAIKRVGADPVFVDIDPDSYNMDPSLLDDCLLKMSKGKREKVKAIVPVHLYGQCCDMTAICEIAEKYDLVVIEDAAQAIGSEHDSKRAGSMGDYGCFSFYPSKNLGAFGDGGVVTTTSEANAVKLKNLRVHGSHVRYYHNAVGGNFRLDALQAAIVSIKLKHLDTWTAARQEKAQKYRTLFKNTSAVDHIKLPKETQTRHVYNQFVAFVKEGRDELRAFLSEAGVGNDVYYPVPLHLQACFSYLGYKEGDFPISEKAAKHTIALPIFPELINEEQEYVVEKVYEFFNG